MITIPYYETSNLVFSNFSPHIVVFKGITFPTVEHAFHWSKFDDEKIKQEILSAKSPAEAYKLGRKYKPVRRGNWDEIKVGILEEIVRAKVAQHEEVKNALLQSGTEEIIEDNPLDDFWGGGADMKGQNNMGKILMRIRAELQKNL